VRERENFRSTESRTPSLPRSTSAKEHARNRVMATESAHNFQDWFCQASTACELSECGPRHSVRHFKIETSRHVSPSRGHDAHSPQHTWPSPCGCRTECGSHSGGPCPACAWKKQCRKQLNERYSSLQGQEGSTRCNQTKCDYQQSLPSNV
jgi:hypothetical protein